MTRSAHVLALRSTAALGVAATLCGLTAPVSHALGLPEPVSTAVGGVASTVRDATGGLGAPVPGTTTTTPGTPATGATTSPGRPSSSSTTGSGRSPSPGTPSSTGSSTKGAADSAGSGRAAPESGAVVDSPATTVCLIPTGTASPAVRVDLEAAGVDLSSPLVKQFPQALAPCPEGAVPTADHVISLDAAIKGLLGACVRVTRQVVPAQTTLVVLDRDLVEELGHAGVPLDRLVVPCPGAASAAPPVGDAPARARPGHPGANPQPGEASALPAGLAFTGSDSLPMALVGAGLLWLGVLLTRRARAALSTDAERG